MRSASGKSASASLASSTATCSCGATVGFLLELEKENQPPFLAALWSSCGGGETDLGDE